MWYLEQTCSTETVVGRQTQSAKIQEVCLVLFCVILYWIKFALVLFFLSLIFFLGYIFQEVKTLCSKH